LSAAVWVYRQRIEGGAKEKKSVEKWAGASLSKVTIVLSLHI
ncbi:hypothetical protein EE612_046151, partial [Oryza sativa]